MPLTTWSFILITRFPAPGVGILSKHGWENSHMSLYTALVAPAVDWHHGVNFRRSSSRRHLGAVTQLGREFVEKILRSCHGSQHFQEPRLLLLRTEPILTEKRGWEEWISKCGVRHQRVSWESWSLLLNLFLRPGGVSFFLGLAIQPHSGFS